MEASDNSPPSLIPSEQRQHRVSVSKEGGPQYGTFAPGRGRVSEDRNGLFTPLGSDHSSVTIAKASPSSPTTHTNAFIYCSHFLSAWGDRMWSFGVGLFLVGIASNNLQLPAAYGLASGLAIFLLGALVGDWIDSAPRLKAAQLSLILQNILVAVCAGVIYFYIRLETSLLGIDGRWAVPLCYGVIIILAVLADLASLARVIAVERDWIVKVCGTDTDMLANMSSTLRRIDQLTLVLAPVATGQVMTYAGLENGALFIGGWNLGSLVLEYYLLWKVYTTVPALRMDKHAASQDNKAIDHTRGSKHLSVSVEHSQLETSLSETHGPLTYPADRPGSPPPLMVDLTRDHNFNDFRPVASDSTKHEDWLQSSDDFNSMFSDTVPLDSEESDFELQKSPCHKCCGRVLFQFVTLYRGWRTYMRYSVALAGLALACLYMTVLGFDNITVAYAVTQGVSESVLGILMGVSAVFGMLGTWGYPLLRRRVGLVRTGMIALTLQVTCLSLCVISVWMPGSPFDPSGSGSSMRPASNSTIVFSTPTEVPTEMDGLISLVTSENSRSSFTATRPTSLQATFVTSALLTPLPETAVEDIPAHTSDSVRVTTLLSSMASEDHDTSGSRSVTASKFKSLENMPDNFTASTEAPVTETFLGGLNTTNYSSSNLPNNFTAPEMTSATATSFIPQNTSGILPTDGRTTELTVNLTMDSIQNDSQSSLDSTVMTSSDGTLTVDDTTNEASRLTAINILSTVLTSAVSKSDHTVDNISAFATTSNIDNTTIASEVTSETNGSTIPASAATGSDFFANISVSFTASNTGDVSYTNTTEINTENSTTAVVTSGNDSDITTDIYTVFPVTSSTDVTGLQSYTSVILLMAGIILARFGLWMADLAITQLFLEDVVESERGIVNGVQGSLNKLMDVLKFFLVVAIPDTENFGFLIIISFGFISLGWLLYAIFLRTNRGHIFHCNYCTLWNYKKI